MVDFERSPQVLIVEDDDTIVAALYGRLNERHTIVEKNLFERRSELTLIVDQRYLLALASTVGLYDKGIAATLRVSKRRSSIFF